MPTPIPRQDAYRDLAYAARHIQAKKRRQNILKKTKRKE